MSLYSHTDKTIVAALGQRLRRLRLGRNITQKELADAALLSLNVIKSLEAGKGKISSLIAVMREMQVLDQMGFFLPEQVKGATLEPERPVDGLRQRASGSRVKDKLLKNVLDV